MNTILYIKLSDSSFINADEMILKDCSDVESFTLNTSSRLFFLISLAKLTVWMIRRLGSSYAVYSFFVGWYLIIPAVLCRVTGIPLVVSVGGFDANWIPRLHYGVYNSFFSRMVCGFIYRTASILLPVHDSLIDIQNTYSEYNTVREGFMHLFPKIRGRIIVIPSGFDTDFWSPGNTNKETIVLTVGGIQNMLNYELKGMSDFVEAARRIPEYRFIHVGAYTPEIFNTLIHSPPKNLTLIGFASDEELLSWYRRARVYAQLSISEGLPNSLIQALLCGCVPVGSTVNGIPDIIGDTGFLIHTRDVDAIEKAIRSAMTFDSGEKARRRAVEKYSMSIRYEKLINVFRELKDTKR